MYFADHGLHIAILSVALAVSACGGGGGGGENVGAGAHANTGAGLGAPDNGGPAPDTGSQGNPVDYSTSFTAVRIPGTTFQLTAAAPDHLDVNEKFTLTQASEIGVFVAPQYAAKIFALDEANVQAFFSGQQFVGYLLNDQGGPAMTFKTLPPGTYWLGTVPDGTVPENYANTVYHKLSHNRSVPKWKFSSNVPFYAAGDSGVWKSQGFNTPAGDWRAYIETGGNAGKFMLMTTAQYNTFAAAYREGYGGGSYDFVYACGGNSGGPGKEIDCELKQLSPASRYYLVFLNDTGGWAGGAANISFYLPA